MIISVIRTGMLLGFFKNVTMCVGPSKEGTFGGADTGAVAFQESPSNMKNLISRTNRMNKKGSSMH